MRSCLAIAALTVLALAGCAGGPGPDAPTGKEEKGIASWYGPGFNGKRTANGEIFNTRKLTAAHRTLPFDTIVEVRNLENGRKVRVRINDRGPFVDGRIIDLSRAAAKELDMVTAGIARVELRVVAWGESDSPAPPAIARDADNRTRRYTVQVGAFRDAERAAGLVEELQGDYPQVVTRGDGEWHRVQVGSFEKRKGAEKLRDELLRIGWTAIVVAYVPAKSR